MDLVQTFSFFTLSKALFYDGFTVNLSCYHSDVSSDYDNMSLVVTVKSDERLIKSVENKILKNLGSDYEITITKGKLFTNLKVTSK